MGHSWISVCALATFILTCIFAWAKGSAAEKLGATLVLAMDVVGDVALAVSYPHTPQIILFTLDFALAAGLLALAIRYSSLWLGMAMLLQSIALCAHAFQLSGEGLGSVQWMILNNIITELMLLCIVIATALSWRARGRPATTSAYILVGDAPAH